MGRAARRSRIHPFRIVVSPTELGDRAEGRQLLTTAAGERGRGLVAKRGDGDRGVYAVLGMDKLDELPLLDLRTSLVLVLLVLAFCGLLIWNLFDVPVG